MEIVIRRAVLLLLVPWLAMAASGQGISGVTRRTPTLEKQAAARRFWNSSGVLATNGATVSATSRPGVVRPAMAVRPPLPVAVPRATMAVRPAVTRTNAISTKTPSARAHVVP